MNPNFDVTDPFLSAWRGSFTSALRWPQLDALWERVRANANAGWYLYAVGEQPPSAPAPAAQVLTFIAKLDALLRTEHVHDYCGIVYADDLNAPTLIKIYNPNNLGVSCGFSTNPPLPSWVMSLLLPCDLSASRPAPNNRRRWWQRLFAS